jgi:hypothetical protein
MDLFRVSICQAIPTHGPFWMCEQEDKRKAACGGMGVVVEVQAGEIGGSFIRGSAVWKALGSASPQTVHIDLFVKKLIDTNAGPNSYQTTRV